MTLQERDVLRYRFGMTDSEIDLIDQDMQSRPAPKPSRVGLYINLALLAVLVALAVWVRC